MACCIGKEHSHWCKDYDIVYIDAEGKEYCIFHAPAEHKYSKPYVEGEGERPELMSGNDFNELVFARIQAVIDAGEDEERDRYALENWNPRCNFAGTIFFADISFSNFNGEAGNYLPPINFISTQFRGEAYFISTQFRGEADFRSTQFRGGADFRSTQFRGEADFRSTQFRGVAYFFSTQFREGAYFRSTQFRGEADFRSTQFRGVAYFFSTQFREGADFRSTQFRGGAYFFSTQFREGAYFSESCFADANFINAESRKKISFKDSTFGKASFDSMNFQKSVIFTGAWFLEETLFTETIFHEYSNFEGTEFYGKTNFKHALFKEWTYFRNVVFNMDTSFAGTISKETILIEKSELSKLLFTETNIESFRFVECTWPELDGRKVIYDEKIKSKDDNNFLNLEEIYRRLKKISRENNDEISSSAWHYKEKEMLRKRLHHENKWTSLRTWFLRIINNMYWIISGYGEEPLQAFIFLCLFILGPLLTASYFGPFYEFTSCGETFKDNTHLVSRWLWYIPLTKVQLTCANVSDWNYFFKAFFNLLITLQAALLAFALRNKLRR